MTTYDLINRLAFGTYLEIGVQEGNSLFAALETKRVTFAIGIDTWGIEYGGTGRGNCQHVLDLCDKHSGKFALITGDSKSVLPNLNCRFDFIFIDGDHFQEGCLFDLSQAVRLMSKYGIILVDDIDHPQHSYLHQAVKSFAESNSLSFEFSDAHFGCAILKR